MKIRIAVVTDENGEWSAFGYSGGDESEFMGWAAEGLAETVRESWVTVDVPLPEKPAELVGEVEEA